ncbi:MAG: SRPBCC family protein, partial [Actinomycetota bacterium]
MSTTVREMKCSPEEVFAVLADGWLYPCWVVGASRRRNVDERWPAVGSAQQHSFGVWPMLIDDESVVIEFDPPKRMAIRAKGWHMGAGAPGRPSPNTVQLDHDGSFGRPIR